MKVNREQYLQKKLGREREFNATRRRVTCLTCYRKEDHCLCSELKPFKPKCELSLLMHPKEGKKQKIGTGRLTHAILENSHLFIDVNMDENSGFRRLLADPNRHHVLLYPSRNPEFIDQEMIPPSWETHLLKEKKTLTFHILDATWPCAKKMMRESKLLQGLPTVSFKESYRSRFVIKHQPHEECLSTIETAYICYEGLRKMALEEPTLSAHENLQEALSALVKFQLDCENDPNLPSNRGTKPKEKKALTHSRIRPKKNRLFYWDLEKSEVGHNHNY